MTQYSDLSEEKKLMIREASKKYYHKNKEKQKTKHKEWSDINKDYIRNYQRESKRKRKLWAIDYFGGACNICKEVHHPSVYEFHHIDSSIKDRDPSKMLQLSLAKLTIELSKCIMLCANCHRIIHHNYGDIDVS